MTFFPQCPCPLLLLKVIIFLLRAADCLLKISIQQNIVDVVCLSSGERSVEICQNRNYTTETENKLQSESGLYLTYYRLLVSGPTLVLAVWFGIWSDKNGRRGIMFITSVGWSLSIVFYILSVSFTAFRMELILIGACVQGIFGNSSIPRMAAKSYTADMTSEETRSSEISMIVGTNFLGQLAGTLLAGVMFYLDDISITLYTDFTFLLLAIVCIACFLPDSVPSSSADSEYSDAKDESAPENAPRKNVCKEFKDLICDLIMLFSTKSNDNRHHIRWILVCMILMNQSCRIADWDVLLLYVKRKSFLWTNSEYSFLLSVESIGQAIITMAVVPFLSRTLKISDISFLFVATPCLVLRYIWAGFMDKSWMVYTVVIIGTVAGLLNSSTRSLLSKTVSQENSGKVFALVTLAETISKLFGAVLLVNIYSATVSLLPGFVFLVESSVYLLMTIMAGVLWRLLKSAEHTNECEPLVKEVSENDNKPSDIKTGTNYTGGETYASMKSAK